jgi:hypothetical protein
VIHFEGSGAPLLKINLRREKVHRGVGNVVGGRTEFAGHAKEILNGPFDIAFTNNVDLTFEAINMLGATWLTCAEVGDTKKEAPESMTIGRSLSLRENYKVGDEGAAE